MEAASSANTVQTQALAHSSYNPPTCAKLLILRASNLCKQGVAGSNPVTSTNSFNNLRFVAISSLYPL